MLTDSDAAGQPLGRMILPRLPSIVLQVAMIYSCFRYINKLYYSHYGSPVCILDDIIYSMPMTKHISIRAF